MDNFEVIVFLSKTLTLLFADAYSRREFARYSRSPTTALTLLRLAELHRFIRGVTPDRSAPVLSRTHLLLHTHESPRITPGFIFIAHIGSRHVAVYAWIILTRFSLTIFFLIYGGVRSNKIEFEFLNQSHHLVDNCCTALAIQHGCRGKLQSLTF